MNLLKEAYKIMDHIEIYVSNLGKSFHSIVGYCPSLVLKSFKNGMRDFHIEKMIFTLFLFRRRVSICLQHTIDVI